MNPLPLIYHSIPQSSYTRVRLRHIKYISQLTLLNNFSFSENMQYSTYKKLKQLKKVSQLVLTKKYKEHPKKKYQRNFLQNVFQTVRVIKNSSIITIYGLQQLKNLKVLKTLHISELQSLQSLRSVLFLRKLEEIGLHFESKGDFMFKRLFAQLTKMMEALPFLQKVRYEGSEQRLVQAIDSGMKKRNIPLKQFLLNVAWDEKCGEVLTGPLLNVITTFLIHTLSSKTLVHLVEPVTLMKNLLSLSLTLMIKEYNFEHLTQLENLKNLQALHFSTTYSLKEYVYNLSFPKSLNTLVFQAKDIISDKDIVNQNTYTVLCEKIAELQNLKTLRIEVRSPCEESHKAFQNGLKSLLGKMPSLIEEIQIVEWYREPKILGNDWEKGLLPYCEVLRHLDKNEYLKNVNLYMGISTFNIDQRFSLRNLVDLSLTINAEECKANDIICSLNPEKMEYITIINRGRSKVWIRKEEFSKFTLNLKRFKLLKELRFSRFSVEESSKTALDNINNFLIALEELIILRVDLDLGQMEIQDEMKKIKNLVLTKRKLQDCKITISEILKEQEDQRKKTLKFTLEKVDGAIKTQAF